MNYILPILIASMFISCSYRVKKDVVSIDSSPRGVEVFLKNSANFEKTIGKTPFFYKVNAEENPNFFISQFNNQSELSGPYQLKEECGMSWTDPLINKIPIINKIIPDLLKDIFPEVNPLNISGGRYECMRRLTVLIRPSVTTENSSCKRLVVVPPSHVYKRGSDKIINEWKVKNFNTFRSDCDELVDPKSSEVFLSFLGIDNLSRREGLKHMSYKKISQIGHKFEATHLLFLKYIEDGSKLTIIPSMIDIHTLSKIDNEMTTRFHIVIDESSSFKALEYAARLFRFVPNSLSIKMAIEKEVDIANSNNNEIMSKEDRWGHFPTLRLGSIDYPHREWGVNFRFSPSLSYKSWHDEYEVKFFNVMMALKMNIHTPIGAIRFRWAFGRGRYSIRNDDFGYNNNGFGNAIQYGVAHFFFVSPRIFIMNGLTWNRMVNKEIQHLNKRFENYREIYIRVGYYFPELKMKVRSFFHDDND